MSAGETLTDRLAAQIAQDGPLTVAQYMTACLHDPQHGYYATRPALGERGDFITAPLISQMFGELIGVWVASVWMQLGEPASFQLVELGPGDGTLMADLLWAAGNAPGFSDAAEVWLVELSEPLREHQRDRLTPLAPRLRWAQSLDEVPGRANTIFVSNELLDCLPPRQFIRTAVGWAERVVGLDPQGGLRFGLVPSPQDALPPDAPVGAIFERSPAQEALGRILGQRIVNDGGAALLIDYGRAEPGFGDTLQALRQHAKLDPLANPGEADLTVHADFPSVLAAAQAQGAATAIISQAEFLARMAIGQRAEALARARPEKAGLIGRQLNRLIAADQMGELFKAACIHRPNAVPPAFESA
ncbi:class I SAM-dependent methyltransferase [Phenylobacterium immobile]|uniref:class I SAM-dependent methyltransferase n=1 Tax=Phenylobacterium immobile TaxID=21 RepID=UPI000AAB43E0|nr:class I SAM-dependent methyltransferase [Phenylobacterium immobile]